MEKGWGGIAWCGRGGWVMVVFWGGRGRVLPLKQHAAGELAESRLSRTPTLERLLVSSGIFSCEDIGFANEIFWVFSLISFAGHAKAGDGAHGVCAAKPPAPCSCRTPNHSAVLKPSSLYACSLASSCPGERLDTNASASPPPGGSSASATRSSKGRECNQRAIVQPTSVPTACNDEAALCGSSRFAWQQPHRR